MSGMSSYAVSVLYLLRYPSNVHALCNVIEKPLDMSTIIQQYMNSKTHLIISARFD
jgi:hypothetical protein